MMEQKPKLLRAAIFIPTDGGPEVPFSGRDMRERMAAYAYDRFSEMDKEFYTDAQTDVILDEFGYNYQFVGRFTESIYFEIPEEE